MISFFSNPIVQSVALPWIFSQFILKPIIASFREKKLFFKAMIQQGGMPSAHSTLVSALATSIGISEGFESGIFLITLVFSLLVVYESLVTKKFISHVSKFVNTKFHDSKLQEGIGHTLLEIVVGIVIGILGAWYIMGL